MKSEERREKNPKAEVDERRLVRCLPFDRISYLKIVCEKHPLSAEMKRFLTPENYYEDCFGIMRMEDEPVERIRILQDMTRSYETGECTNGEQEE